MTTIENDGDEIIRIDPDRVEVLPPGVVTVGETLEARNPGRAWGNYAPIDPARKYGRRPGVDVPFPVFSDPEDVDPPEPREISGP